MAITTRSAKNKGVRLQNAVRDLIIKYWPTLDKSDVKPAVMGETGLDIKLSTAARKKVPLSIECKARNKVAIYSWYEQAVGDTVENTEPLLVVKADRKKPLVCVDAEYFFKLLKGTKR